MGFYIDLDSVSLKEYRYGLKKGYLPPSRMVLLQNIDEHFEAIEKQGIKTAGDLFAALKTKKKTETLSAASGIELDYLIILSREIRSLIKKPALVSDFSMISEDTAEKLKAIGIKNTLQFYEKVITAKDRQELSEKTGISKEEILIITQLAGLSRIRWVNHTFAQVLYEVGYRSAKEVARANDEELRSKVNEYIKQNDIYKDSISLNDIRICMDAARLLENELEL